MLTRFQIGIPISRLHTLVGAFSVIVESLQRFVVSSDPCAGAGVGDVERGEAAYRLPQLDLLLRLAQAVPNKDADY